MRPPIHAYTTINEKLIRDMATAELLATPALAKKSTVIFSLNPRPPIEIGNKVIAPIMGKKMKK